MNACYICDINEDILKRTEIYKPSNEIDKQF